MNDSYNPYNPYETDNSPKIEVNFKRNRISTKKAGIGTVNAGGAIIIIIFVVLCLTIFGLLSFTTSFADKKLADRNLESVTQYYKADSEAEETLAKIYDAVNIKLANNFNEDLVKSVISNISDLSAEVEIIDVYEPYIENLPENETVISVLYRTDMGSGAAKDDIVKFYLNSEVNFCYNQNANAKKLTYKISEWKITMESGFEYDNEKIDVWSGQF